MKKLQYIGPSRAGIDVPTAQGEVHVPHMSAGVELDDELARELLEHEYDGKKTWRVAPAQKADKES